jgi:hypothetical protein
MWTVLLINYSITIVLIFNEKQKFIQIHELLFKPKVMYKTCNMPASVKLQGASAWGLNSGSKNERI